MQTDMNDMKFPEAHSAVAWRAPGEIAAIKSQCGGVFREVDLSTTRSKSDLLTKIAVALDFPDYFAGNWDSFEECLAEPDSIQPPARIVLILRGVEKLFALGDETETLFSILRDVSGEWSAAGDGFGLSILLEGEADERSKTILDSVGLMSL